MPSARRLDGPTVRLAIAVAAMLAVAVAGFAAPALGLVPHRPEPSADFPVPSGESLIPHDFPDLEAALPRAVAGAPDIEHASFDGEFAIGDESLYGGAMTVVAEEFSPPSGTGRDPTDLQVATGYYQPDADRSVSVTAYRVVARTAAGWRPILARLAAGSAPDQLLSFREGSVGGRPVLIGRDAGSGSDVSWVLTRGDLLVEVLATDRTLGQAAVAALP